MSPIPDQCGPQAQAVTDAKLRFNALADQANTLTGEAVWPVLIQLATARRDLASAQEALTGCIEAASSGGGTSDSVTTVVTVHQIDTGVPSDTGTRELTMWEIGAVGAVERETAGVGNDENAQLRSAFPDPAGFTVRTTDVPDLTGLDFRSASLSGLPPGQLRIEIVLGPEMSLKPDEIERSLAPLLPMTIPVTGSLVSANVVVTELRVAMEPDTVVVDATGTVSGSVGGIAVGDISFSATAPMSLTPDTDPQGQELVIVSTAHPIEVEFSGSLLASLATLLSPLVAPLIENLAMSQLRARARAWLPTALAEALEVANLPAGSTVTARKLTIDPTGLTVQPAIGCVGTALSTYDPPPISPL